MNQDHFIPFFIFFSTHTKLNKLFLFPFSECFIYSLYVQCTFHPYPYLILSLPTPRQGRQRNYCNSVWTTLRDRWMELESRNARVDKLPEEILNHDDLNGWYPGQQQPNHGWSIILTAFGYQWSAGLSFRAVLVWFCFVFPLENWSMQEISTSTPYKRGLLLLFFYLPCTPY